MEQLVLSEWMGAGSNPPLAVTAPEHSSCAHTGRRHSFHGRLEGDGMDLIFFSITIYSYKNGAGKKDTADFVH